ncbi:MAG: glycosyltransferase family 2 protein [Herminiimonas sp.]|nr:glycosyltransferase family 2 protein [Herminiimonas sp.]
MTVDRTGYERYSVIIAVVVTYQPDIELLLKLLSAMVPQVHSIVIVDNGSHMKSLRLVENAAFAAVETIALESNVGISKAQNIGISRAKEIGADYILLSDQDSIPHHSMVKELMEVALALRARGLQVACVGPRYLDSRQQNPPPFIRIRGLRLERCGCATRDTVVPVDYLVASGCLIPTHVLEQVGAMREDLFIDYVDIEWGLRARLSGFQSYGVCAARMLHSLGDQPINFLGKTFPLHSPLRHYYHFRNAILLYKEPWVPLNWKLVDGWRLCLKYVFYSCFAKPRTAHLGMMTLGVWHGLAGKAGKLGMGDS